LTCRRRQLGKHRQEASSAQRVRWVPCCSAAHKPAASQLHTRSTLCPCSQRPQAYPLATSRAEVHFPNPPPAQAAAAAPAAICAVCTLHASTFLVCLLYCDVMCVYRRRWSQQHNPNWQQHNRSDQPAAPRVVCIWRAEFRQIWRRASSSRGTKQQPALTHVHSTRAMHVCPC
jgi:hypothetical protein